MGYIVNNTEDKDKENSNLTADKVGGGAGQSTGGQPPAPGAAPAPAVQKPASSGQYTNFGNYLQSNKQAGSRLSNLLSSNVQQQGKAVERTLGNTGAVTSAVGAENQRISQDLDKVRGATTAAGTGDFSKFNQFLQQPTPAPAQPGGFAANLTPEQLAQLGQSQATGGVNPPVTGQPVAPVNPATLGLTQNIQNLITGQTREGELEAQARDIYGRAGQQVGGIQQAQALSGTEYGREQLLRKVLGGAGTYGKGANVLDQSLLAGDPRRLSGLLNSIGATAQGTQTALGANQSALDQQLTALAAGAGAAKKESGQLATAGLGSLDTALAAQQAAAQTQRATEQSDVLNQFKNQSFNQDIANKLGVGEGASLMNILKENAQNYGVTADKFSDNPYLALERGDINKSNVINTPQLGAYSAMQRMLQQDPSSFAYQDVGKVDPSYNLGAAKFKEVLGGKYNAAAQALIADPYQYGASNFTHMGSGPWDQGRYSEATYRGNLSEEIAPEVLQQMASSGQFNNLNIDPNAIKRVLTQATDQGDFQRVSDEANQRLTSALSQYLQQQGYNDTASIGPSDFEGQTNYNLT